MITLPDVKEGRVSLSDIAEINHYLDMKQDIEYMAQDKAMKEAKIKRGGR